MTHELAFATLSQAWQTVRSYIGSYCMLKHASKLFLWSPPTERVPTDPSVARHCTTLIPGLAEAIPQLQLTTSGVGGAVGGAVDTQADKQTDTYSIRNRAETAIERTEEIWVKVDKELVQVAEDLLLKCIFVWNYSWLATDPGNNVEAETMQR